MIFIVVSKNHIHTRKHMHAMPERLNESIGCTVSVTLKRTERAVHTLSESKITQCARLCEIMSMSKFPNAYTHALLQRMRISYIRFYKQNSLYYLSSRGLEFFFFYWSIEIERARALHPQPLNVVKLFRYEIKTWML